MNSYDARTGERANLEYPAASYAGAVYRGICESCNGGWMCTLEGKAARLLRPLISGKASTLADVELVTVATWACMKSMSLEARNFAPEEWSFTSDERTIVMEEDRPPSRVAIFAACAEMKGQPQSYSRTQGAVLASGRALPLTIHTLQINTLVLQVMAPELAARVVSPLSVPPSVQKFEVPVFPPPPPGSPSFFWPPELSILDEDQLRLYQRRQPPR